MVRANILTLLPNINRSLDQLEHMSLHDGEDYNEGLIRLCAGDVPPDRSIPVQWMLFDLWESMRACDRELADDILKPITTFMRAQTSRDRLSIKGLGQYLEYRQGDVGQA